MSGRDWTKEMPAGVDISRNTTQGDRRRQRLTTVIGQPRQEYTEVKRKVKKSIKKDKRDYITTTAWLKKQKRQ